MTKDNSDSKVPIFGGKDYSLWNKRILLYLKWKQCDQCALREKSTSEVQTEWDDKDLRAINIIYSSITNEQLKFVVEEDADLKIIKKFDQMYLKESTSLQICIRNNLDRIKLKDYEDSSTFFSEFERQINELKGAGATVKEPEKLNYILKTLPDSLSHIGDLIDSIKEEEKNCSYFKNKIQMYEVQCTNDNKGKPSIFKLEKRDIECFICHQKGRYKKDCTNKTENSRGRGNWRGSFCGRGAQQGGANGRGYWQGDEQHQGQQQHPNFRGRGFQQNRRGFNNSGGGNGH